MINPMIAYGWNNFLYNGSLNSCFEKKGGITMLSDLDIDGISDFIMGIGSGV